MNNFDNQKHPNLSDKEVCCSQANPKSYAESITFRYFTQTKSDMPDEIWVRPLTTQFDHGLWDLHGCKKHPSQPDAVKAHISDKLIVRLKGLKGYQGSRLYDLAIDTVIAMLRGEE